MLRVLPLLFLLVGCFPRPVLRFDVQIRQWEGKLLRSCDPTSDWTSDETEAQCGKPLAKVDQVGMFDGPCLVYENISQALRSDVRPARYYALCFEHRDGRRDINTGKITSQTAWYLSYIVGLSEAPPASP